MTDEDGCKFQCGQLVNKQGKTCNNNKKRGGRERANIYIFKKKYSYAAIFKL